MLLYLINVSKGGRRTNTTGILADRDGLLEHEDELRDETEGEQWGRHRTSDDRSVVLNITVLRSANDLNPRVDGTHARH